MQFQSISAFEECKTLKMDTESLQRNVNKTAVAEHHFHIFNIYICIYVLCLMLLFLGGLRGSWPIHEN